MRRLVATGWALSMAITSSALNSGPAAASTCVAAGGVTGAAASCTHPASETFAYIAAHSGHTYTVALACATDNATCADSVPCGTGADTGLVYNVFEDGTPLPWQACLTTADAAKINGLTPGFVGRAFRRLRWPTSALTVQPPHGRTLVNFDTNFFTTNNHPTTRTVTLLGQTITIRATPITYTWHYDDTTATETDTTQTTSDAGAPYPHLDITHRYLHTGTAHPSVDTTYTGRYRVGTGPWQNIPDTLTVPGPTITLQIVSATPHLVGY